MIAKQTNKQTNKEKINNTDRLDNKQRCICIVVIQSNEKSSMKFAARSAKTLKTMKFLPKISSTWVLWIHVYVYFIIFKRRLESVTKVLCPKQLRQILKYQSI